MRRWARYGVAWLGVSAAGSAADWVRSEQPHWGLRSGVQFALHPAGFGGGEGGPRGLIRLGAPVLAGGGHALVNFIAVEPVVRSVRGFSELEQSRLDGAKGLRFQTEGQTRSVLPGGAEEIEVRVTIEAFKNGAQVRLVIAQRSDVPDEVRLKVYSLPGSAPLDACILTATMGNLVRARRLWLKGEVLSSLILYPDFRGTGFAPPTVRLLPKLARNEAGDVVVAITNNEADPAAVVPFPGRRAWHYAGVPVTQYWRVPAAAVPADLRVAVNARHTYWQSEQPIPGGVAFENFELRTKFVDGQEFCFGITGRSPAELGIGIAEAGGKRR